MPWARWMTCRRWPVRAPDTDKRMKQEYDFSKGERGKFFRENAKLNLPVT